VNNESADIIRMLNTAFNKVLPPEKAALDLYPEGFHAEIDEINDFMYPTINSTHCSLA
jgi:glutathionyl-hydroquinone reductase